MSQKKTLEEALAEVRNRTISEQEVPSMIQKGAEYDQAIKKGYNWLKNQRNDALKTLQTNDPDAPTGSVPKLRTEPAGPPASAAPAPVNKPAAAPASTSGAAKPASSTPAAAKAASSTNGSTGVEKTPAPTPPQNKMSFSQAYAKARELAKSAGKDPNTAQFKWSKDGGPEKTFQAAATKKDYVSTNKQYKVDVGSSSTPAGQKPQTQPDGPPAPKNPTANVPTPPSRPPNLGVSINTSSSGRTPVDTVPANSSGDVTPKGGYSMDSGNQKKPATVQPESGKKKVSEETNPLVAAFLKLQETKAANMFEAAKKLTKKQDEKMDVVDDDKIDAKDLAALRAMKKEEAEQIDEIGDTEKGREKLMAYQNKAYDQLMGKNGETKLKDDLKGFNRAMGLHKAADRYVKGKKKALGVDTLPEDVEFSEAELAHFNDIMEGRPRKNPIESEEESPTKNVAAQVRTTRSTMTDKGEMVPLKHPITGKMHHVPVKVANDFNTKYAGAGKAEAKNKVLADFMDKHMGGN